MSNEHVCPECGEPIVNRPPTESPWLTTFLAAGNPKPKWSHPDGEPLCPVMGAGGYEPATYQA